MPRLYVTLAVFLIALLCGASEGRARADVVANVRLETGEIRIVNLGPLDFQLTGYQITSLDEDLLVGEWLPISGRLDANGDMSFDPDDAWWVFAPPAPFPTTNDELAEGVFTGSGGSLTAGAGVYLGAVWDVDTPRSIEVWVTDEVQVIMNVPVNYAPAGDYDENGVVNEADYMLWKSTLGDAGAGLLADGNADQIVDLADYAIWRDNFGATSPPADTIPFTITSSSVIAEPSSTAMATLSCMAIILATWRRPRA